MKGYIARNNLTFKFNDLKQLIDEAFEQVTAEKWANYCVHVESVEKKYWQNDIAVEKEIERIVIDVNSDDSDVTDNDDGTYAKDSVSDTDINSMEIITCHPSIYTMKQPMLICTISDERTHQHTYFSIDWWAGLKHGMFSAPYLHVGEKSDFAFFLTLLYAKNKGTDQYAHPSSLISVFVFFGTCKVYMYCFSLFHSFRYSSNSVAELAG